MRSKRFQSKFKVLQVSFRRGPTCHETAEGVVCVDWLPGLEKDMLHELLHLRVAQLDKLLVGAGRIHGDVGIEEELSHLHRHVDGVLGDVEVKVVRK